MASTTLIIAFAAGLISFLSPCILPIIPGFMAYLSGTHSDGKKARIITFLNSLAFVLGFSTVFAALGVLLNTILEKSSYAVQIWLSRIGGLVIMLFALHLLGILRIPFLQGDHKLRVKKTGNTYVASFIFGASFAVGWSPCVGAILGSIFALAITQPGSAFVLLLAYALGLGLPFLIVGIFTEQVMQWISKSGTVFKYFNIVVGILLLILGVLVFTNNLNLVASLFIPQGLLG